MSRNALQFTGIIVQDENSFWGLCPELDVASEGATATECKTMLREAVAGYLECCIESNLPYLRPAPPAEDPRFTNPQSVVATVAINVDLAVKVHA